MYSVVIIDDQFTSRKILEKLMHTLENNIAVHAFADPLEAMHWIRNATPDLVLSDYKMPNMDGISFVQAFRELPGCDDIPLVMVTCHEDRQIRYQALEAGATDFLIKPIDYYECRARCRNLLTLRKQQRVIKERAENLAQKVREATYEIQQREHETLLRLARAGEYRDEETGNHVIRMSRYSRLIAEQIGLPPDECKTIELAAPMHDIGKIGIHDHILLKPGRLTHDEFEVMKSHTVIGHDILKGSPSMFIQMGAIIALGHHEKYDGSGYPNQLSGENIPLTARIVAVADVYDALTSVRPYKPAWSIDDAIKYLRQQSGGHFDPACVNAFEKKLKAILEIQHSFQDRTFEQGVYSLP